MSFFVTSMAFSILGVLVAMESILFFIFCRGLSFSRSHCERQFWLFDNGKSTSKWVISVLWLIKTIWVIYRMPTAEASTWIFEENFCCVLSIQQYNHEECFIQKREIGGCIDFRWNGVTRKWSEPKINQFRSKDTRRLASDFDWFPYFTKILTDPLNLKASRCFSLCSDPLHVFLRLWKKYFVHLERDHWEEFRLHVDDVAFII